MAREKDVTLFETRTGPRCPWILGARDLLRVVGLINHHGHPGRWEVRVRPFYKRGD